MGVSGRCPTVEARGAFCVAATAYDCHQQADCEWSEFKDKPTASDRLKKCVGDRSLNARIPFSDFISQHRDDPEYVDLVGVPVATPREIFEAETDALVESYEAQKQILKTILRSNNNIRVTPSTTYEEFVEYLQATEEANQIEEVGFLLVFTGNNSFVLQGNLRLFYDSLKRRAARREREKEELNDQQKDDGHQTIETDQARRNNSEENRDESSARESLRYKRQRENDSDGQSSDEEKDHEEPSSRSLSCSERSKRKKHHREAIS
ncbi:pre-mRNA-processing factor 40 homolog A-like [Condylostylus longicornis]|uniref:pre-mRNA-processing factor 40 homolog A-like n=1 Tax=Condylostylus longicornis TaxID=2530218 RepID=UPI00244E4D47|nr:pre-mRNA-processing factor 40 homolog A-like [Condylostylus longicornis]